LETIAKAPHPWFSEENKNVYEYIVSYGDSLSAKYGSDVIEISIQNTTQYYQDGYTRYNWYTEQYETGSIINVAYLIKGKKIGVDENAIQVSAHYDGVPVGPGASDDGAGIAIMMEIASALAARSTNGEKLERDVLILFVDAEETGLVGAKYWVNGIDDLGNDISHPWSKLASFAVNMEGSGTATSGAMLIRSNSRFATDAYRKFALHPKAVSLTEWIYKTLGIGRTDSDKYWTQGIHLMDLIWIENRWAYHSQDDSIVNVRPESLQSCGDDIMQIVSGASASSDFPKRIPMEDLLSSGVIRSGGIAGMESGTVYFSLLGGTMVWMPFSFARWMYIILAIVLGFTMPFIVGNQYRDDDSNEDNRSLSSRRRKCACVSMRLAKTATRHALIALLNLFLGLLTSVVAFAAFGMWKAPSEKEIQRREGYGDEWIVAWGGIGACRAFLSLFTVCGTTLLVYMRVRGECCCRRNNTEGNIDQTSDAIIIIHDEQPPSGDAVEGTGRENKEISEHGEGNIENENQSSNIEANDNMQEEARAEDASNPQRQSKSNSADASDEKQQHLNQIGRDAHIGVFYFYVTLLLILGAALPDSACLVMWQPIFMWFASLIDAFLDQWYKNNQFRIEARRSSVSSQFVRWLTHAFVSAFPTLLLLPAGFYILVNAFGYFMDDMGYWFGAPLVDSFCFGLIIPLFTSIWLPIPQKAFLTLGVICGLGWASTAISAMVI